MSPKQQPSVIEQQRVVDWETRERKSKKEVNYRNKEESNNERGEAQAGYKRSCSGGD